MNLHQSELLLGLVGVPVAVMFYLFAGERVLALASPAWQREARPVVWMAPAIALILGVLIYPLGKTVVLSLEAAESSFPTIENYREIFSDDTLLAVLRVNLMWIVLYPLGCTVFGLASAVLLEKVPYQRIAKAIITIPTAISFVASSVMWQLVYAYAPPGSPPLGTLNGLLQAFIPDFVPRAWLVDESLNNIALNVVGIWMGTGLATLILSAAMKGVPRELIEAARLDGAGEWRVLRHIVIPELKPALIVVATTSVIGAIKVFDIVYVMTGGNYRTDVIATRMYSEQFAYGNTGLACALAVILVLAVTPVLLVNRRAMRREAA